MYEIVRYSVKQMNTLTIIANKYLRQEYFITILSRVNRKELENLTDRKEKDRNCYVSGLSNIYVNRN